MKEKYEKNEKRNGGKREKKVEIFEKKEIFWTKIFQKSSDEKFSS